jgi:hypothetical protein
MSWTSSHLHVFGPRRKPFKKEDRAVFDDDGPMWMAHVEVLEQGDASSPAWRHLYLQRDPWSPDGHSSMNLHMPGAAVVRCRVEQLYVKIYPNGESFRFDLQDEPPQTLLVHTIPDDDVRHGTHNDSWHIGHWTAGQHFIRSVPTMLCAAGRIPVNRESTTGEWRTAFAAWGDSIGRLEAHSSGVSFQGVPHLAWTDELAELARFNVQYPRPAAEDAATALLVELDRQWLHCERSDSLKALAAYVRAFRRLDEILRSSSQEQTRWVHLALRNPAGPPQFHWLLHSGGNNPPLLLRRGETMMSLSDQVPGTKHIPRSVASIDGDVTIQAGGNDEFTVKISASRDTVVVDVDKEHLPADFGKWVGKVRYEQGKLRWLAGRFLTKDEESDLEDAFPDLPPKVWKQLLAAATFEVPIPPGVTVNLPNTLDDRTTIEADVVRWYGLVRDPDADVDYQTLVGLVDGMRPGSERDVLQQLVQRLGARVDYEATTGNAPRETFEWNSIETTYDANDVAHFLRGVHGVRRPDPDELNATPGAYRVEPAMLWGCTPLDTGWAMLPFFNLTDELYLRMFELPKQLLRTNLLSGTAIFGNDDAALWSKRKDEQRWSLGILDADQVDGLWTYRTGLLVAAHVKFHQPELVLQGFLYLASAGPTPADALPETDVWPRAFRTISLRSSDMGQSYPSPYVHFFEEGGCARVTLDPDDGAGSVGTCAVLEFWTARIDRNVRQVKRHGSHNLPRRQESVTPFFFGFDTSRRTARLEAYYSLTWFAGKDVTARALADLDFWVQSGDLRASFRQAVQRLATRLQQIGVGNVVEEEIREPFRSDAGRLPWPRSAGWLDLLARADLQLVVVWNGSAAEPEDHALLSEWIDLPAIPVDLRNSLAELLLRFQGSQILETTVYEGVTMSGFFASGMASLPRPLVWRRHPSLPAIQTLPMTQSLRPPSHPSSSRQLAPFEVRFAAKPNGTNVEDPPGPLDWVFRGVEVDGNAATSWPEFVNAVDLEPAVEWTGKNHDGERYLSMSFLTLPGLASHPTSDLAIAPIADPTGQRQPLQLTFGLPYLMEPNALAQLPKTDTSEPGNGALELDPQEIVPPPLFRETFGDSWQKLSDLALWAATDADAMIQSRTNGLCAVSIVEPYVWPVDVSLAITAYPGVCTLSDSENLANSITLTEPIASGIAKIPPLPTPEHSALRGIQGTFEVNPGRPHTIRLVTFENGDEDRFDVVAGTAHATVDATARLRDQRGLWRSAATDDGNWTKTPISLLDINPQTNQPVESSVVLCSARRRQRLDLGQSGEWDLWFRDLPMHNDEFRREETRSAQETGVNDPIAESRRYGHLQGYEWSVADTSSGSRLYIGKLPFYPLLLENLTFENDQLHSVSLIGRLQLPLPGSENGTSGSVEREADANAVRVRFERRDGNLKLTAIELPAPDACPVNENGDNVAAELVWPLHASDGAPRLRTSQIRFREAENELELYEADMAGDAAQVDLSLFGIPWSPSPADAIRIPLNRVPNLTVEFGLDVRAADTVDDVVRIRRATVKLDLESAAHGLSVRLHARWGELDKPRIEAEKVMTLLPQPAVDYGANFRVPGSTDLDELPNLPLLELSGKEARESLQTPTVQVDWQRFPVEANLPQTKYALYVLPGFGVTHDALKDTPGYAAVSFEAQRRTVADWRMRPPQFVKVVGASEILFRCDWGKSLQEIDRSQPNVDFELTERAFSSSAGSVSIGMLSTIASKSDATSEADITQQLMLNGMLEVKNLVSWPAPELTETAPDNLLYTLPTHAADLNHWRHTARILLNQLELSEAQFGPCSVPNAGESPTLFGMPSGQVDEDEDDSVNVVQFVAVVEHQLAPLNVALPDEPDAAPKVEAAEHEFRWSVAQEVRFAHPAALRAFWENFVPETPPEVGDRATADMARDNRGLIVPVGRATTGWLRTELLSELIGPDGLEAMDDATAVVEMSVAFHLLRRGKTAVENSQMGDFADVQVLPGQIDRAIPADLSDLIPMGRFEEEHDPEKWSLVVLPCIGRMQPAERDGLDMTVHPPRVDLDQPSKLCADPVLWLSNPDVEIPDFVYDLTSRPQGDDPAVIRFGEFDRIAEQYFDWLDPASLETGWFRILSPPPEEVSDPKSKHQLLASVFAALPSEGLARLSRKAALESLFDPRLATYPPAEQPALEGTTHRDVEWRYGGLLVLNAIANVTSPQGYAHEFSFVAVGKRLGQVLGLLLNDEEETLPSIIRLPSLALLPPRMPCAGHPSETALDQAITFTPSPYLGIRREPVVASQDALVDAEVVAVFADIVVTGRTHEATSVPVVVASRLWREQFRETEGTVQSIGLPSIEEVLEWARETRRGMAGDSRLAVVRVRQVKRVAGLTLPWIEHKFYRLGPAYPVPLVPPPQRPLRPELGLIRAREGQIGQGDVQDEIPATDLAPPQVRSVHPLHLENPPVMVNATESLTWDWGYSGLRYDCRLTEGEVGQVGAPLVANGNGGAGWNYWWVGASHPVQFAFDLREGDSLLPDNFRGPAIRSLLPAPPNVPCPPRSAIEQMIQRIDERSDGENDAVWQSELPGGFRMLDVGGRPGAFMTLRPTLQTQYSGPAVQRWRLSGRWSTQDEIRIASGSDGSVETLSVRPPSENIVEILLAIVEAFESQEPDSPFARLAASSDRADLVLMSRQAGQPCFVVLSANETSQGVLVRLPASSDPVLTSGSIPVQHRWPRPVHLPANRPSMPSATRLALYKFLGGWTATQSFRVSCARDRFDVPAASVNAVAMVQQIVDAIHAVDGGEHPAIAMLRAVAKEDVLTIEPPLDGSEVAAFSIALHETSDDNSPLVHPQPITAFPVPSRNRVHRTAEEVALAPWGSRFDLQPDFAVVTGTGADEEATVEVGYTLGEYNTSRNTVADQNGNWSCAVERQSLPAGIVEITATSNGQALQSFTPKFFPHGATIVAGIATPNISVLVTFSNGRESLVEEVTANGAGKWFASLDWHALGPGLIDVLAMDENGQPVNDYSPRSFLRGLSEVSGYGATPSEVIDVHFVNGPYSHTQQTMVGVDGRWTTPIGWSQIPAGRVKVSATNSLGNELPSFSPEFISNHIDRSVDVRQNPHDSLLVRDGELTYELHVELVPIAQQAAAVSDGWPNDYRVSIQFETRPNPLIAAPFQLNAVALTLSLCSQRACIDFPCIADTEIDKREFKPADVDRPRVQVLLDEAHHGDPLWFELKVPIDDIGGISGPPLTVRLPVRRVRSTELPLPLAPTFALFEDPEYSRSLTSPTARATKTVKKLGNTDTVPVTLALDRQEYNPTTPFFLLVDALNEAAARFTLTVSRITAEGAKSQVGTATDIPPNQIVDIRFGAAEVVDVPPSLRYTAALSPGDRLEFEIEAAAALEPEPVVVVSVQVVRDPVTPPPEAGYALLRRQSDDENAAVECVRFAWGPAADRIELVDPGDLRRQAARRRAVFRWQDTIRPVTKETPDRAVSYAIQKLHSSGSTHVPRLIRSIVPEDDLET